MHPYEMEWRHQYNQIIKIPFLQNLDVKGNSHFDYIQAIMKRIDGSLEAKQMVNLLLRQQELRQEPSLDIFNNLSEEERFYHTVAAWATILQFKNNKYIYSFDPKLCKLLGNSKWKDIPTSYVQLPKSNFAVFCFNHNETDNTKLASFCISQTKLGLSVFADSSMTQSLIPLMPNSTTEESYNEMIKAFEKNEIKHTKNEWLEFVKNIINALLYILGNKDVVKETHPGVNPKKKKYIDPKYGSQAQTFYVGKKYRHLIERYELDGLEPHNGDSKETGRTVRPHVRSAHFQAYWVGKGRKQLDIKFVMSCLVNGHLMNFTDMDEDITDVK